MYLLRVICEGARLMYLLRVILLKLALEINLRNH